MIPLPCFSCGAVVAHYTNPLTALNPIERGMLNTVASVGGAKAGQIVNAMSNGAALAGMFAVACPTCTSTEAAPNAG